MTNSKVWHNVNAALFATIAITLGSYSPMAQSALPVCESASSDPDGDGYGWENNNSCIVAASSPTSGGGLPACQSAGSDSDGDGYGWETMLHAESLQTLLPRPPVRHHLQRHHL